jgi:lactoylglutathione lyase
LQNPKEAFIINPSRIGLAHFAFSTGSREAVNELTAHLRADGYTIVGEPRTTGDGYYESIVLDPEKNFVEITA